MKRILTLLLLLSLIISFTGCVSHVFKTPKTISTEDIDPPSMKVIGKVAVEQTSYLFLIIPFIRDPRKLNEKLLTKAEAMGANAVIDVQYNQDIFYALLFMKIDAEATGTAVLIE